MNYENDAGISSGTVQTRLFKLCTRTKILTIFYDKEAGPTVKSLQEVNNWKKLTETPGHDIITLSAGRKIL